MVSSFVVFTYTTVGLRRAAPHQTPALDLPVGRLISRTAAGFRQAPRPPRRRGELILRGGEIVAPGAERIVITEDDEDLAFVLREALIRKEYEVEIAPTAAALIEAGRTEA